MNGIDRDLSNPHKTGILHFGLGAFHRAHQVDFTQDAIDAGGGNWCIEAVSMRDARLANAINHHNDFSLLIKRPEGDAYKNISVIKKAYCLGDDPALIAQRIAAANIHIITITVTEKGYGLDRKTGGLNTQDPIVQHDLANPSSPKGLLGILVAGLDLRKQTLGTGLTLISCDNLPSNGKLLKRLVLEFARVSNGELANWIADKCTFPCSMVDRITPASTDATYRLVGKYLGRDDPLAVETEPFRQWVIEDDFAGPRPAWEQVGLSLVKNVEPFELMKLRMLNGAHSFIAYLGTFLEFTAVRDVMANAVLSDLIDQHMILACETLPEIQGFNLDEYRDALVQRFKNTAIVHRCFQIAMDGSQKLPQRIFAPAKVRLDAGKSISSFALATALWMKHIEGKTVFGAPLPLNDPMAETLKTAIIQSTGSAADQTHALGKIDGLETHGLFAKPEWLESVISAKKLLDRLETQQANSGETTIEFHISEIQWWFMGPIKA
jgi:fructuronate reductase